MALMLRASDGGYDTALGWTGNSADIPEPVAIPYFEAEADSDDTYAHIGWQSLTEHNNAVSQEMRNLVSLLSLDDQWQEALLSAVRWHDAGKAHEVFQRAMLGDPPEADISVTWAKTGRGRVVYERKGFRHELASAIVAVENGLSDLVAYLVAAHHGKVRVSIRSLPHETRPDDPGKRFARGIWDGDKLPETNLGGGERLEETLADLSLMELGNGPHGASWFARMLALRDDPLLGPFRLAYLEGLLRVSDWRASMKTEKTRNGR
jgi:CRISPR-associated endonuclease/helicase Cas3